MTGAQFSPRTLCSVSMVHNCICVQFKRAVMHNRRGVQLVGAQLYLRVACPVDMVHSYSRAQSVRAQSVVLNRYRAQSCAAQSVPSPRHRAQLKSLKFVVIVRRNRTTCILIYSEEELRTIIMIELHLVSSFNHLILLVSHWFRYYK